VPVEVVESLSYVDSVVLGFPSWVEPARYRRFKVFLEDLCGGVWSDTWGHGGERPMSVLMAHQPSPEALFFLDSQDDANYAIWEIHIALDLITRNGTDAQTLHHFIAGKLMPFSRGIKLTEQVEETTYLNADVRRGTEVTIYHTLPSKARKGRPCTHIEFRLRGARELRKHGLSSPLGIFLLDHREFWNQELRLVRAPTLDALMGQRDRFVARLRKKEDDRRIGSDADLYALYSVAGDMGWRGRAHDLHMLLCGRWFTSASARSHFIVEPHGWMLPGPQNALWV
jgi:hypothetical protein